MNRGTTSTRHSVYSLRNWDKRVIHKLLTR